MGNNKAKLDNQLCQASYGFSESMSLACERKAIYENWNNFRLIPRENENS